MFTQPVSAGERHVAEKIQDISPNKKFAMRISYDAEMYRQMLPDKIDVVKMSVTLEQGLEEETVSFDEKTGKLPILQERNLHPRSRPWHY